MPEKRIALVTGANKGIGLAIVKGLAQKEIATILTARDSKKGETAALQLKDEGLDVGFCQLDITNEESIQKAYRFVEHKFGRLDILINNAGIFIDEDKNPLKEDINIIRRTLETNLFGHIRVTQVFIPLMKKNNYGRIVNVSSGLGQLTDMNGGYMAYRISKTALNAFTRVFSSELKNTNIVINTMCPGWVRTDMGGANADRTPEEGADTAIYLATLPDSEVSGNFFRNRKTIPW